MQKAAIYVRDPLRTPGNIVSNEAQVKACREYGLAKDRTASAMFRETAGNRDDTILDFMLIWKLHRFSRSLEGTIELRDKLRRVGSRLASTAKRCIDH